MDAITALHTRVSSPKLAEPAPTGAQREAIFQAALRAPDHVALRTWRYLCVEGDARRALGEKMLAAMLRIDPQLSDAACLKRRNAPLRAPLVIVGVVSLREHPKVPEIEQWLSVGAGLNNMLLAAYALGFGAIWRTGQLAFDRGFMRDIGLAEHEHIVGFLYLGSTTSAAKTIQPLASADYFSAWPPAGPSA